MLGSVACGESSQDGGGSGGSGATTWHLALRPPLKDDDSPDHLDSVNTVLGDGIPFAQRAKFLGD